MIAMHAPDGFLEPWVAAVTALLSVLVAVAGRRSATALGDRQVPLAGVAAAFIFAAQMFNFPVASGTTGHLLGGTLAAILLGPWVGTLVVTVVVVVQALMFADGGLTALGYNVLNMADRAGVRRVGAVQAVPPHPAGELRGCRRRDGAGLGRVRWCWRRRRSRWSGCSEPPRPSRSTPCSERWSASTSSSGSARR